MLNLIYSVRNTMHVSKTPKGYSMHLVLVPLLCCFSLLGMDADTARLPKKCFGAALSDNCVTSCEGFIFNKDPHHPVACLSTLMLLYEGEKSVKDITNLKATQGFLQTRIKKLSQRTLKNLQTLLQLRLRPLLITSCYHIVVRDKYN